MSCLSSRLCAAAVLVACVLVAFFFSAEASPLRRHKQHHQHHNQHSHHKHHHQQQHRRPEPVDGFELVRANSTFYSVCVGSTKPVLPFTQPIGALPTPVIDAATSATTLVVQEGQDTACVAWGYHSDLMDTLGWSYLSIETNPSFPDYLQSRAAGILEGFTSQVRIQQNVNNLLSGFYPNNGVPSVAVTQFLNASMTFKLGMINQLATLDTYWGQVANLYLQVQGISEGYMMAITKQSDALSWFDIYSLQLDVDIGDITTSVGLFSPLATAQERHHAQAKMAAKVDPKSEPDFANSHCSSLIKLLPNNTDLLIGHDTWAGFNTMLRTFKLYNMPLRVSTGNSVVHMSSYPGFLFSSDDWYQLQPSVLTVTETSNDIYAPALYDAIQPASVAIWTRTLIANRLATTGAQWAEVFSRYNSGTCDNQWIIIDHKLFTAGSANLQPGLLTISEQMPGWVITRDMTSVLQSQGYWSSFNIPYFTETYVVSGYGQCPGGDYVCSYYQNFRYLLFQQQQSSVVDLKTMQQTLLYNEWQTNPLQHNSSRYAIAQRGDLAPSPDAFGGIDGKITSDSWMKEGNLKVSAYSGPTIETQPVFCWNSGGPWTQPAGLPTCYNFPWTTFQTESSVNKREDSVIEQIQLVD